MGNDLSYYSIGPTNISIRGNNQLSSLIKEEFEPINVSNLKKKDIDLSITILDPAEKITFSPKYYSGNWCFNERNIMLRGNRYDYLIENLFEFNKKTNLYISYGKKEKDLFRKLDVLTTFINRDFNNTMERIKTSVMSYSLFWYVFHIVLLKKRAAFLHSGILDCDDKGVIFTGTGGCGKTSLTFKLLENYKFKFLSEDFGVVNSEGKAFFNPKFMAIYGTDVNYGQKDLVNFVDKKMNFVDTLQWKTYQYFGKNPRRKISPNEILSARRISKSTEIKFAYYLSRYDGDKIKLKNSKNEEFVERCSNAAFRELKQLYEMLTQIKAVSFKENDFPTLDILKEKTRKIYRDAFDNAEKKIIFVPKKASPQDIIEFIGIEDKI